MALKDKDDIEKDIKEDINGLQKFLNEKLEKQKFNMEEFIKHVLEHFEGDLPPNFRKKFDSDGGEREAWKEITTIMDDIVKMNLETTKVATDAVVANIQIENQIKKELQSDRVKYREKDRKRETDRDRKRETDRERERERIPA